MKELGVMWNLSMAYHPQTNGLTEQKNQWVKQFLHLISTNQDDWSTMLPLTTLVYNNTRNTTTGLVPNQLLNGLEPAITPNQSAGSNDPTVELYINQLRQQQIQATKVLNMAANSKSPLTNMFKHRQKVWLKAKNLALPYGSVKLAPRHHGPFPITQMMSLVMYKLTHPHQWTIHPVFHASLLTPYSQTIEYGENYLSPPLDLIENAEQYEVETIRSHQCHGRKRQLPSPQQHKKAGHPTETASPILASSSYQTHSHYTLDTLALFWNLPLPIWNMNNDSLKPPTPQKKLKRQKAKKKAQPLEHSQTHT